MKSDNIPNKPTEIPTIFALQNKWEIPDKDLKTLYDGPLLAANGKLIVKPDRLLFYYWRKMESWVKGVGSILTLFLSIYGVLKLLNLVP